MGQSFIELDIINSLADYQSSTCMIIYDGNYTCTGTLINNSSQDGRPLILTAAHCIEDPEQINSIVVVFGRHYLLKDALIESEEWRSDFGANLLSFSYETDHALLELNQELPDWLMPRFLGWNGRETKNTITSSIHHPTFDFKELAHNRTPVEVATFNGINNSFSNGHWRVNNWSFGSTLQGSSGAALLDSQLRIIGGLSGSTIRGDEEFDFYYRLDEALKQSSDLVRYLDPDGSSSGLIDELNFSNLRSLYKLDRYSFTDSLAENYLLTNQNSLVQSFGEVEGVLRGVYLAIDQIEGDLLDALTITIQENGNTLFAEEVNLFTLLERSENFVPFINPLPVDGSISIAITSNAGVNADFVEFPSVNHFGERNMLNALLVEELKSDLVNEGETFEIQVFPNPADHFFTINSKISELSLIDFKGDQFFPNYSLDHNQHTLVSLEGIQASVYIVQFQARAGEILRRIIIVR